MNPRRLGAFEIGEELGRGGMGVVYRGEYAGSTPVAVKVIAAQYAQTERRRREFRREVHAMARLNHPHIVTVFDTGLTDDGGGATPWYAMELVDGAPLCGSVITGGWRQLKMLLLDLLDALAHAHARGVIHRDFKPANILVARDRRDLRATLVDFGIAHALQFDAERSDTPHAHVSGTPSYMAPEQVTGRWRDEGPWTDLYALGCMVWRLVCGRPPFAGESTEEVLRAHLRDEIPRFSPAFDVPDELEDWLRTLLQKSHRRRFRRAADAAHALFRMRSVEAGASGSVSGDAVAAGDYTRLTTLASVADTIIDRPEPVGEHHAPPASAASTRRSWPLPVLPPNWKRLAADVEPKQLTGAGLGLFGLREISVVDREPTRRAMWEQLSQVHAKRSAHAFVLRGPTGCGKSRLSQWLGRRAHETGCAIVLEARHAPHGGPMDGLGAMLRRFFRADGLSHDEILERVRDFYRFTSVDDEIDFYDTVTITGAIAATRISKDGGDRGAGEDSIEEQADVFGRFFALLSAERPLVLIVEDAQWAGQTLAVIRRLVEADRTQPLPLLVIATARDDAAQESGFAADQLASLCEYPDCQRRHLAGLGADDQRLLVGRLLGLTEETVERVVERTDGNPLFATQILDHWVDQGALTTTPKGFVPTAPLEEALPRSPEALWRRRIDGLMGSLERRRQQVGREALEVAALLGQHAENEEWQAVVAEVGLSAADMLVDEMVARNLATRARDGWSFRHAGLCDSLESTAQQAGRLAKHHRRCADMLEALYPQDHYKSVARQAHHLFEAGEYDRALPALLVVVEMMLYDAPLAPVKRQLLRCEDVAARLEHAGPSAERSRLLALWGWYYRRMGQIQDALESVEKGVAMALDNDWEPEAAFGLAMKGILLKQMGQLRDAEQTIEQAVGYFGQGSDPRILTRALTYLAITLRSQGRLEQSIAYFEQALELCIQARTPLLQARVECALGYTEFSRGNNHRARELLDKARLCLGRAGKRGNVGIVINNIGDIARHEGRWDEALAHYREAVELSRNQRDYGNIVVALNTAFVEVGQRRWKQAEPRLERLLEDAERVGHGHMMPHILLALAGCAAHAGDEQTCAGRITLAIERIHADQMADKDLAWLAELVADKAAQRGWPAIAREPRELALSQYETLGDQARVRRIEQN